MTDTIAVVREHLARAEEQLAKYGSAYCDGKVAGLRNLLNELEGATSGG
jgi:hypothetical protein